MNTNCSLSNELRTELINVLCNYPPLTTRDGRDVWLMNLPANVSDLIIRRHEHCKIDLAFIIEAIQLLQLQDGRWPILILIDAILADTENLAIAQKLSEFRHEIQASLEPPAKLDSQPEFEELIIGQDEKVRMRFLKDGLKAAKAVARIKVPLTAGGQAFGTGWLIAPDLLLTCEHVIGFGTNHDQQKLKQQAEASILWLGYDVGSYTEYHCLNLVHTNVILDYAVLRIAERSVDNLPLSDWGILDVIKIQPELSRGTRLNVIQHPGGRVKEIALRTNFYIGSIAEKSRLHYLSDTEGGSSGSPVLDDNWQVVGMHRAWDYYNHYYKGQPIQFNSLGLQVSPSKFSEQLVAAINEGVLIHTILEDLPDSVIEEIEHAQGWL